MHAIAPPPLAVAEAPPPQWRTCVQIVREATATVPEPIVLVGHSGGGLLLPAIAAALAPEVAGFVFVDSGLPAITGSTELAPPPKLIAQLRSLAVDGRLPRWSSWWDDENAMAELVPDEGTRAELVRRMPSLPLSYFEKSVPSPAGWDRVPCGYVLLSAAYTDAEAEARARGWPVEEIAGAQHLHTVVAPRPLRTPCSA